MSFENIILEVAEGIATVTFNRPKALNALNTDLLKEFSAALDEIAGNEDIRVLVLTGAGEKSFVAGADYVMIGSLLSGTDATPGEIITADNGEKFKRFRGMASNDAQISYKGKGKYLPAEEGISSMVSYKGSTVDVINELKKGLQSGMSYCNSRQLKDIFLKAVWNIQTASGYTEGTPHLK